MHVLSYGTLAKSIYELSEQGKSFRGDFLERLNISNSRPQVCRAYLENDVDLAIEAVFQIFTIKLLLGFLLTHSTMIYA